MPHINTAMTRSLQRGVGSYVLDSVLGPRGITDQVNGVKTTFSSWDSCMEKVYCKWPVIVGIVVGGLIALSVVWCIIRCACCGMSCCCTCFSFLKCCDCCGGCCDGRKDRPHKHLDENGNQAGFNNGNQGFHANQGYQSTAPMMGGGLPAKPAYEAPQFAQFEVGKSGHAVISEDALPPMPSWETAQKKHVPSEDEKDGVELGELDPATGQRLPLMAGAAGAGISSPSSPANEFGAGPYAAGGRPGMPGHAHGGQEDPYGQNLNAYNQNAQGYRGTPSGPPSPGPPPMMAGRGFGPGQADNYGPLRGGSPGPNNGYTDAAVGGYGQGQGQYPNDRRQFPPQPVRQYSADSARPMNPGRQYTGPQQQDGYQQNGYQQNGPPRGPSRGPRSPPPVSNAGFDFGIDGQQQQYSSRPSPPPQQPSYGGSGRSYSPAPNQQQRGGGGYSTGPPSYATRSPPPQEPNYQAYAPQSEPRAPGPASSAAGGRAREPEHWDPVQHY